MPPNPYAAPEESEISRPRKSLGWMLFGSLIGLVGLVILGSEVLRVCWAIADSEFRRMLWSGGNPYLALVFYTLIGLLFIASARCAFKQQPRLALAFLFLPIALFSVLLLLTS